MRGFSKCWCFLSHFLLQFLHFALLNTAIGTGELENNFVYNFQPLHSFSPVLQRNELLLNASVNCLGSLLGFLQRKSPCTGWHQFTFASLLFLLRLFVCLFFSSDHSSAAPRVCFPCRSARQPSALTAASLAGSRTSTFYPGSALSRTEQNWTKLIPVSHCASSLSVVLLGFFPLCLSPLPRGAGFLPVY